jgi:hypothetical protein
MIDLKEGRMNVEDYSLLLPFYQKLNPDQYIMTIRAMVLTAPDIALKEPKYMKNVETLSYAISRKNLELDPDLIALIEDTDADLDTEHIPYDYFFVNHQFNTQDITVNGFCVAKGHAGYFVIFVALDNKHKYEFYSNKMLGDEGTKSSDPEEERMRLCALEVHRFARNLIEIINHSHKDIEYIDRVATNNEKRVKRGQAPKLNNTYLRLSGTLKVYASKYKEQRGMTNIRYLVRGHWRRFESDFYVNRKGEKEWIYPYYRGEFDSLDVSKNNVRVKL